MKSIGLNLALIIGEDSNLTALRKSNVSRLCSPRATLANPRIIIGRNYRTKSHAAVITAAKKATYSASAGRRSKRMLN